MGYNRVSECSSRESKLSIEVKRKRADYLFLDIALLPSGEMELMDAAEMDEALQQGIISTAEYDLAWREANRLMGDIRSNTFALLSLTSAHRDRLLQRV